MWLNICMIIIAVRKIPSFPMCMYFSIFKFTDSDLMVLIEKCLGNFVC